MRTDLLNSDIFFNVTCILFTTYCTASVLVIMYMVKHSTVFK